MRKLASLITLKLLLLLWLLIGAQCQTPEAPLPISPPPTPAVRYFPPIPPGDGSDLLDRLLERGVVRVGIRVWPTAEFVPPAFRGAGSAEMGGPLSGYEVDLAFLLAEGLGLELELVEAYPPVIASGDWRGEWDIALASLTPFDQPPASAVNPTTYSQPYGFMPLGILVPQANETLATVEALAGQRVGVLEHSAYQRLLTTGQPLTVQGQPLLPSLPPDLRPVPLSNLQKTIRELGDPTGDEGDAVDAIFGPTPVLREAVRAGLPVKLAPQARVIGFQPLAVAITPQEGLAVDRLVGHINDILDRARRQGFLTEIYQKWYSQDFSELEAD